MFVLIVGGGPVGVELASLLMDQDHHVRLIEPRREILSEIHRMLPTEVIIEGNPMDFKVLEAAGIREARVLVACTPSDSENLVLCYLAHKIYSVPSTIGRINNPAHAWLFGEIFQVNVALNESSILAHLIEEEMSTGDMMTLLKLRRGEFSLVEVRIPPEVKAAGAAIKDLPLPEQCVIAAIIRQGRMVIPRGTTILEVGDEVLAVTNSQGEELLATLFALQE